MNYYLRLSAFGAVFAVVAVASGCSSDAVPMVPTAMTESGPPATVPASPTPEPTPAPVPAPPVPPAPMTARYRVTFTATWSPSTHPIEIPGSAHFSALVGGTHDASVAFWQEGVAASTGIKDMAERGRTSPFDQEIKDGVARGVAESVFTGGAIDKSPGSVSLEFSASQRYPLVTLVSMIAPSPDWFVGVNSLPLFDGRQWTDERRVDLVPWDAGTDSGVTFFAPDAVTAPPVPIFRILTPPLSPNGQVTALGQFVFTRLN